MDWSDLQNVVELVEVGPRDGLQSLPFFVPTKIKIEIIEKLIKAGLRNIQVTSFVNPKKVPQFNDAEEVIKWCENINGVVFTSLVLNKKGLIRAINAGAKGVEISISANDEFSKKNTNMSFDYALNEIKEMLKIAKENNLYIRASIQCAFGYKNHSDVSIERVMKIMELYLSSGVHEIVFADTTGLCNPKVLNNFLKTILKYINNNLISMHFHSKMNIGLINIYEAFRMGITRFDTSFGFIGGCPFVEDFRRNVSTEEAVNLFKSLGINTKINIDLLQECSKYLNKLVKQ